MNNAAQLERDAEVTRARIASTLDELRASMTPGRIIDDLAERASDGAAAAMARNLRDQAIRNPMPLALMGASLAWLMLGGGARSSPDWRSTGERFSGNDAAESVRSAAEDTKRHASQTGDRQRDVAGSMTEPARQSAFGTIEAVRETAGSAARTGQRALQSGSAFLDFCREQPMLLTGLGIAVGALVGILLPATEAENRLMGETSDGLKENAQDLATDKVQDAKKIGERALDAAAEVAKEEMSSAGADQDKNADRASAGLHVDTDPREERGPPTTLGNAPI
jgi:ElaB/YqjD/DUF883 family membrane-anchored ribosome-binding protein